MNVGLIAGRVLNPDASRAGRDCTVYLRKVSVEGKPLPFVGRRGNGLASTTLDSDGEFTIPFAWDRPDVAGPPASPPRIFKYAEFDVRAVNETRDERGRRRNVPRPPSTRESTPTGFKPVLSNRPRVPHGGAGPDRGCCAGRARRRPLCRAGLSRAVRTGRRLPGRALRPLPPTHSVGRDFGSEADFQPAECAGAFARPAAHPVRRGRLQGRDDFPRGPQPLSGRTRPESRVEP